ncbi:hypothetical protein, partial [Psychroserpens mesophilus]|uniref:hypothetical protein n=1 Tax=Psychroserpens mesophilus TaxID=325473 RepID=UPI003D65BC64
NGGNRDLANAQWDSNQSILVVGWHNAGSTPGNQLAKKSTMARMPTAFLFSDSGYGSQGGTDSLLQAGKVLLGQQG